MTAYAIHGQYPKYTLTRDGEPFDRASDMASIMAMFTWRLEPGDSITWEVSNGR